MAAPKQVPPGKGNPGTPPPGKKKKGKMPAPGASTPAYRKIAASMLEK